MSDKGYTCQRTPCKTLCQYKVYDPCSYIHEVKHVILDDSAQIGATLTHPLAEVESNRQQEK